MPEKLKVISLNIFDGGRFFDEIIEFLKNENPDIVLLQEVFNGQDLSINREYRSFSVLQEKLGFKYSHFASAFLENVVDGKVTRVNLDGKRVVRPGGGPTKPIIQQIEQGNAIFSKFPIEGFPTKFYDISFGERVNNLEHFSVSPRNLQHVLIDLDNFDEEVGVSSIGARKTMASNQFQTQKLHVFNTHGIWGTHGGDTDRRLKMAQVIIKEILACNSTNANENYPIILAGDFNLKPKTQTIEKIKNILDSVFEDELVTSFNLARKDLDKFPGYATAVVDMMFVSKGIEIISHKCPDVDVSDHLPLVVELAVG